MTSRKQHINNKQPDAPAQKASPTGLVSIVLLIDGPAGRIGQVVEVPAAVANGLISTFAADSHPEAIAAALGRCKHPEEVHPGANRPQLDERLP